MAQCNSVLDEAVEPKRDIILLVLLSAHFAIFCIKLLMYLVFCRDNVYKL